MQHDFEKLGTFYLGRVFDAAGGQVLDEPILYDARDLTTHALCVGMTGSGKTGLGIALLEEAAIDGIPAIVIDPKGDMGNLLLNFPALAASDFAPWVDADEAMRQGQSKAELAAATAERWSRGLLQWGQDGARVQRLRNAVDMCIYTPGSTAGVPLRLLRSFDAPPVALREDGEAFAERVQTAVGGLLALLGIDADPVTSREYILLTNIVQHAWREGRSLELAGLIRAVQAPPFAQVGVFDLDAFYPPKDRFGLAMALNNLLASPGFAPWLEGEPLEIRRLLYTDAGKPRVSILSLAHLGDAERMFFVTLLLNELVAWMRTQSGTSSLRALLYMDEIYGYFPPSAQPPSKRPMLTLLKQARAFGVGVVLSTQNPVDLDYKGLANCGTWFLGRLQTERDKQRVLDGLDGAMTAGGRAFDRAAIDRILSGLGKRVFLMNNVHEDAPVTFQTRFTLSYLRGPLTRDQIRSLSVMRTAAPVTAPAPAAAIATTTSSSTASSPDTPAKPPVLPVEIRQRFLPRTRNVPQGGRIVYRPAVLAMARLHYVAAALAVDEWETCSVLVPLGDGDAGFDPAQATIERAEVEPTLLDEPERAAQFADLPREASQARSYAKWQRLLRDQLYQTRTLPRCTHAATQLSSRADESEAEFRARVVAALKEARDLDIEKLRRRYAPRLEQIQERIRKAEDRVERERDQYGKAKTDSIVSIGSSLLGALFGRKVLSATNVQRTGSIAKSVGRASKEKGDIERAAEDVSVLKDDLRALEQEFEREIATMAGRIDAEALVIDREAVRPRKTDITLSDPSLVWLPTCVDRSGMTLA